MISSVSFVFVPHIETQPTTVSGYVLFSERAPLWPASRPVSQAFWSWHPFTLLKIRTLKHFSVCGLDPSIPLEIKTETFKVYYLNVAIMNLLKVRINNTFFL